MALHDLTADMLTRIRNACRIRQKQVTVLNNKLNRGVAGVLAKEGYIRGFEVVADGRQGLIRLDLKYGPRGENLIHHIERVSRTGCRIYRGVEELPSPMSGLGIAIVSTSMGVMSDRECREKRLGGEVVATVA
ncbi:MAG: 30S ribosomal protein S8 [Phycisphaerales bacterium]|jgi:small subunit ribosomal protein S8